MYTINHQKQKKMIFVSVFCCGLSLPGFISLLYVLTWVVWTRGGVCHSPKIKTEENWPTQSGYHVWDMAVFPLWGPSRAKLDFWCFVTTSRPIPDIFPPPNFYQPSTLAPFKGPNTRFGDFSLFLALLTIERADVYTFSQRERKNWNYKILLVVVWACQASIICFMYSPGWCERVEGSAILQK